MTSRPFRFGLNIGSCKNREDLLANVRRAEGSGYSVIVAPDHFGSRLAVLPMLVAAAEAAPSMRVSPMVIANDYRHPAILAKETATIDILTGGRFELGLGTGWLKDQYLAAGISYDSPRIRVDRLEEAIGVIKGLWAGGPFSFEGAHYRLAELESPRTTQRPHPPLLIAGGGPRMLRLAGSEADIVSISPFIPGGTSFATFDADMSRSSSRIEAQLGWIEQGAGARFGEIELSVMMQHAAVAGGSDSVVDRIASTTGTSPSEVRRSPYVLVGTVEEIVESLLDRRERYGISYFILAPQHLEPMQPVVDRLQGL